MNTRKAMQLGFASMIFSIAGSALAAILVDEGKIATFFAATDGAVAITLAGGFPNAISSSQCPTVTSGFAGMHTGDPIVKSTLLAAKSAGQTVKIVISGCEPDGGWYKITQVYIQP